jgi:hypothetical protein
MFDKRLESMASCRVLVRVEDLVFVFYKVKFYYEETFCAWRDEGFFLLFPLSK